MFHLRAVCRVIVKESVSRIQQNSDVSQTISLINVKEIQVEEKKHKTNFLHFGCIHIGINPLVHKGIDAYVLCTVRYIPRFGESTDNTPPFPKTSDPRGFNNLDPTTQISLEINGPDQILAFHLSGLWQSLHPLTPAFESPKHVCVKSTIHRLSRSNGSGWMSGFRDM
jgi:hypothetical protein